MRQEDIYYRAGGKITHAGVECLDGGKDTEFVIDRIEFKDSEVVNGRVEQGVWLMHFKSNPYTNLPIILNSTNKRRLVKLFPECEGYLARIKNKPVRMTKELTRDPQGGGQVYGLRVSLIPAKEPVANEKKELKMEQVSIVAKKAREKGLKFEEVEIYYTASEDVLKALKTAIEGKDE